MSDGENSLWVNVERGKRFTDGEKTSGTQKVAPGDSVGEAGDFYVDVGKFHCDLYGPKTEKGWPATMKPMTGPLGDPYTIEGQINGPQ